MKSAHRPVERKTTLVIVSAVFLLGFMLRLWLAHFANNDYPFDVAVYRSMSEEVYKRGWAIDRGSRTVYYPVMVAGVFGFFGFGNYTATKVVQTLLDAMVSVLVFITAWKLTKNASVALLAMIFYALNPLTASYTGLLLTETLATFLTAALLTASVYGTGSPRRAFAWGLLTGLWGLVRITFFPFAIMLVLLPGISKPTIRAKVVALIFSAAGFMLLLVYPTVALWQQTSKLSVWPANPVTSFYLYEGLKVHEWPEIWSQLRPLPEGAIMHWEFDSLGPEAYRREATRMLEKFIGEVRADPVGYIGWRLVHLARIWNKTHLFYYEDPWYPADRMPIAVGNAILLFFGAIGVATTAKRGIGTHPQLGILVVILLVAVPLLVSLRPPEVRLTVPLYPAIMLFAAIGLSRVYGFLKRQGVGVSQ